MLTPDLISEDLWGFFHAGHMATDIKGAVTVAQNEPGAAAHARLTERRFDQAPVVFHERVVGWVLTSQLFDAQTVESAMTPLDNSAIVSAQASVPNVLRLLGRHDFVFTADKDGLAGFIVRSDLDRHAVRSYFYLLVAGIEMLLSEVVKVAVPESQILAIMHPNMRKRYEQAHKINIEADPIEYLYIRELVQLFLAAPSAADPHWWDRSLTHQLSEVRDFRNSVMHPSCSIAASVSPNRASELATWAEVVANRLREIVLALHASQIRAM